MNGHAPADLVSRRQYIGLRHANTLDPETWLAGRPAVRALVPTAVRRAEAAFRKLCAFYADLRTVLGPTWAALRPDGRAVYVIANNVIRGARVQSHRILAALAREVGFAEEAVSPREIAGPRRRFPVGPFGFDGPMTHEYLVVLRKPKPRRLRAGGAHARPA